VAGRPGDGARAGVVGVAGVAVHSIGGWHRQGGAAGVVLAAPVCGFRRSTDRCTLAAAVQAEILRSPLQYRYLVWAAVGLRQRLQLAALAYVDQVHFHYLSHNKTRIT